MDSYKCTICGYVYNPTLGDPDHGIEPGTAFEDLPAKWTCPICLANKSLFERDRTDDLRAERRDWAISDQSITDPSLYKERFENLSRVARKVTSSLSIGNILEMIRDEARTTVPGAQEACLLILDPDALHYTRPLHCAVYKDRINCQLCKRGRETIEGAMAQPLTLQCVAREGDLSTPDSNGSQGAICEAALPIFDGDKPLGVLDVIAKEGHGFDERDITLLKDLADLATNAILNARQHWKMAKEKHTIDSILAHLRPFVPETVQKIVEKDPFDPSLKKRSVDVSVVFLDIAGYSKMSESISQEKVNFIIEKYFSSYLDVIYKFGGDINETAGDGLMVIFQGKEHDNALSASRAALYIRKKTLDINEELEGRFQPVDVHVGINSGTASVGMTQFHGAAGTRMTFTASGPITNLAARIAAVATQWDILVGPETARRIREEIPVYDRGSIHFKNIKDPVQVYSLVRAD
jgi:class 3 adenylate cyclase/rubredoxin